MIAAFLFALIPARVVFCQSLHHPRRRRLCAGGWATFRVFLPPPPLRAGAGVVVIRARSGRPLPPAACVRWDDPAGPGRPLPSAACGRWRGDPARPGRPLPSTPRRVVVWVLGVLFRHGGCGVGAGVGASMAV